MYLYINHVMKYLYYQTMSTKSEVTPYNSVQLNIAYE